jgi:sugar fermentation stimulation protein A
MKNDKYRVVNEPVYGRFMFRQNRFVCDIESEGESIQAYLPNTGRLEELLIAGRKVLLEKRRTSGKTLHDIIAIETDAYPTSEPIWASLDSRLPPKLLAWAISTGKIPEIIPSGEIHFEPPSVGGRFDLAVETSAGEVLIETKSVNLVDSEGTSRFPDARTIRGTRHIRELADLAKLGIGAYVVFVVTRADALCFAPFAERDADFAEALVQALKEGVRIVAFAFEAGSDFRFIGEIPVEIPGRPFPCFWPKTES